MKTFLILLAIIVVAVLTNDMPWQFGFVAFLISCLLALGFAVIDRLARRS